ncbi:MAG: hypothetical protein M3451_12850 [Chloroflexota bacterium]|nr:hypothetical protein [Chloroflexota bacterium]
MILPLLVGMLAIYQDMNRVTQYTADARLSVVRIPDPRPVEDFRYDEYYNYLTSEFKIDDLVETVNGNVFAGAVAERLTAAGMDIDSDVVQQTIGTERRHRVLFIMVTTNEPERSLEISQAAVAELEENAPVYLDMPNDAAGASVRVVEYPNDASTDTTQARIILALGVLTALGAGVLLAFLVDYHDDTLYDGDSAAAATKLPLLATVPADPS